MRRWAVISLLAALLGLVVALGGLAVSASGIIPIAASSGHFAITSWFLHFSMQRSVATHTLGRELPALDDPVLVLRGAGHYETGCRPCHGAPDLLVPGVPRSMLPPPPYLPDVASEWQPKELFYIVKHGVKFTGMPMWPTQERDDEVLAVVAFLVKLPGMDADAYRRLVHGPAQPAALAVAAPEANLPASPAPTSALAATCARCHGNRGEGRENAAFPRLAGQRADYLANALRAYANAERYSGIMQPIAAGLRAQEITELATYYASLPAPPHVDVDPQQLALGRAVALRGVPAERVPACADCHGPRAKEKNSAYPILSGQYPEFLMQQLDLLKQGHRGGSRYVHIMHRVVNGLTAEQMHAVAAFYAAQ